MNMLDVIIAAGLIFGVVRGFIKGLIVEVISLVAVLLGIVVAIKFSPTFADYLDAWVDWSPEVTKVAAYGITFALALLVAFLSGKLFTKLAEAVALGLINKFLGALFGLVKYGMIISVLLILYDSINKKINVFDEETLKESILFERVKGVAPLVFPILLDLEKDIEKKVGTFNDINKLN